MGWGAAAAAWDPHLGFDVHMYEKQHPKMESRAECSAPFLPPAKSQASWGSGAAAAWAGRAGHRGWDVAASYQIINIIYTEKGIDLQISLTFTNK